MCRRTENRLKDYFCVVGLALVAIPISFEVAYLIFLGGMTPVLMRMVVEALENSR